MSEALTLAGQHPFLTGFAVIAIVVVAVMLLSSGAADDML